jgi:hypothetical protein
LILLAGTALLLGRLAGFIRHLIRLTGLVALLRLILLILVCHFQVAPYQQALHRARANGC